MTEARLQLHQAISRAAYLIWEREGRPHGRDREHWLRAVEEISASIVADPVVLRPAKGAAPKTSAAQKAKAPAPKSTAKAGEAVTVPARVKAVRAKTALAKKK